MNRVRSTALALTLGAALAVPGVSAAQRAPDGFLFEAPGLVLSAHGGYADPSAGSEVFDFVSELLTVGPGDFGSFSAGGSVAAPVTDRLDILFDVTYTKAIADSEFRDWVESDDSPIRQRTRFVRAPALLGARYHLLPRGRTIGSFAWVPNRFAPYVGVSGGAMRYEFSQEGDFVDFEDETIFTDRLASSGWAPALRGVTGVEVTLTPRLAATTELGYLWARAPMRDDFEEFDRIDLSGFAVTAGISIRL